MANEKDIKIGISTTADTGGADRAVTALDRLTEAETRRKQTAADFLTAAEAEVAEYDRLVASAGRMSAARREEEEAAKAALRAAKAEQDALDVLEAKRRVAERAAKNHAGEIKNLGGVINQVGFQVTDFAVQTQMGTSAWVAFAQQAPQAIGAIQQLGGAMKLSWSTAVGLGTGVGIIATALAVSGQMVATEYQKMQAELDKAKAKEKEYSDMLKHAREELVKLRQQERANFVSDYYGRQADDLERQVKALERINELRAAQGGLEAAQAAAGVTAAQNNGGDVTAARGNQIAVGAKNQIDELQSRLSQAQANTAQAAQALDAANGELREALASKGEFSDKYKEKAAEVETAEKAKAAAEADLEKEKQLFEIAKQKILTNTATELDTLSSDAQASATEAAERTREAIIAKIQETGGNVSSTLRDALKTLDEILAKNGVTPDEMARFNDTMNRVRISTEARDERILEGLERMISASESITNRIPDILRRISRIEDELSE